MSSWKDKSKRTFHTNYEKKVSKPASDVSARLKGHRLSSFVGGQSQTDKKSHVSLTEAGKILSN